jgi:chemotaxis response regulator CheB
MGVRPALRVLLVDDYEPFRQFVCSMLSKAPGLQVIGEVSDGQEAVHRAEELQPDLILLGHRPSEAEWIGSRQSYTTSRPQLEDHLRN